MARLYCFDTSLLRPCVSPLPHIVTAASMNCVLVSVWSGFAQETEQGSDTRCWLAAKEQPIHAIFLTRV